MAELAINQYGQAFAPPADAAMWLVRRMHDNKHGGPMQTFGQDGKPITLALTASLADFQAALRTHACPPGRYRLDPLDPAGRLMKGAPVAYLPHPADRSAPPVAIDGADLPRNGNHAGAGPWAVPPPMPPLAWSTGGAFPLPTPNHLTGSEYLLGEALRAQTAMMAIMAQASATASAQHASAMTALLTAAAELVRAADGAKMPTRRPAAAPPPPVIVQQVAPAYPEAYADEIDDEPEAAPEPAPPAAPVWQQKVGEVVDQLLPVAKMVISHKMADMVAGVGADAPTAPVVPVAPRNAAEVEPEPEPEPEVDVSPAAWSHLGAVVRKLGPAWRARVDAQLARMTADERHAFVCSIVSLPGPKACEYVVSQVSVAELRQAHAAAPAAAAPTAAAPAAVAPAAAAPTAAAPPTAGPIMTTLPDTTDGPHAPTEAELPVLTPPSGPAVQATIRGIVNEVMAGHVAPTAPTAPATAPTPIAPTAAGHGALADLVDTLANESSVIAPYLRRIPGGGAGVEAVAASLLGAETLAQINAELDAVPVPPVMQLMTARAAAAPKATAPTAPTAPAAPAASPLADPAVMARMIEVMPHLTPAEQATVQLIAMRMPAAERNKLIAPLMSASLADAVAMVRDAVTKYEAHGRPFG